MGNNNTNFCALIVDADATINASENGGIDTGKNGGYGNKGGYRKPRREDRAPSEQHEENVADNNENE